MEYYYFMNDPDLHPGRMAMLEDNGFSGVLFPYNSWSYDFFTKTARDIDVSKTIKYLIALRAYNISPQYLTMINQSMNTIMPDRLEINFVNGHIVPEEVEWGNTVIKNTVHDLSSPIDRSEYLIAYLRELYLKHNEGVISESSMVNSFVTVTNQIIYETAAMYNYPMIIPYTDYKNKKWFGGDDWGDKVDLKNKKIMLAINPVIVKTKEELSLLKPKEPVDHIEFFTFDGFKAFINNLELNGVQYIMLNPMACPNEDETYMLEVVRQLTKK